MITQEASPYLAHIFINISSFIIIIIIQYNNLKTWEIEPPISREGVHVNYR